MVHLNLFPIFFKPAQLNGCSLGSLHEQFFQESFLSRFSFFCVCVVLHVHVAIFVMLDELVDNLADEPAVLERKTRH